MDLIQRPRRLRGSETLRKMVRETRIDKSSLIYSVCKRRTGDRGGDSVYGRTVPLQCGPSPV